ncbi:hypothetical protein ACMU_05545 [Actibacterium mucosum KCTC 23349]|uniref:Rhamnogalacturonase A/B/Epimerase-like pectate lyase domain-containing protein n=1 Tax=Actibacterium mucosum KCTC 23349 TaxID=1454373 RepID=A0A037ZK06_9RHOB|nr:glycosyl hydrolase family 28-related protein [Actibacterium mucosum]KAJ56408.1 hypothetical protein ACMU_05545 [Actibacterium mucosum KCTC 23349]
MNKAITEGLVLMPPAFAAGLNVWSSGDGTPGSATYDGAPNAAIATADQDFGDCLELQKNAEPQKVRYMGQTPIQPGCYLRVTARVKAISGNLPNVRIAAFALNGAGNHVNGLVEIGPETTLTAYGEVVEVSAIIGSGNRGGVDMVWGTGVQNAHVGLDLTGNNGGVVRIDDLIVEDVTSVFLRDYLDWVDVRDYGAIGDGVTDDAAAFNAADAAANGRSVLVPAGTFHLGADVTFTNKVRFEGTVTMPTANRLTLVKNYELNSYVDAFGDELEAFKRAVAVLFNFSDHDSLDLNGRQVDITEPIDVQAAVGNKTTFSNRRVIRNGIISASASSNWDTDQVTSQATYAVSSNTTLTNVTNVANIQVGSLVEGLGVGREVYVRSKNVGAGTITLSQPLFDAVGTQTYTFKRFKYLLDFSGWDDLDRFVLADLDLRCAGQCSGVLIPPQGIIFTIRDCFFTGPKDRGISSHGNGCQGMQVDRCQFLSNEQAANVQDRVSIAMNCNANDVKIRDNRVVRFKHFAIIAGTGNIVSANHFFQGDATSQGLRDAGMVLTRTNVKSTLTANYIDNCWVEWTNEHDSAPEHSSESSFGALTLVGNIFFISNAAPWTRCFVIKPVGPGHFIHGLNVTGNTFKSSDGAIERVESVDTTFADLDYGRFRNVQWENNTYTGVTAFTGSPVMVQFDQSTNASTWNCDFSTYLPFGGRARNVDGFVAEGQIQNASNQRVTAMPYVQVEQGTNRNQINLVWPEACRGRVHVTGRVDNFI